MRIEYLVALLGTALFVLLCTDRGRSDADAVPTTPPSVAKQSSLGRSVKRPATTLSTKIMDINTSELESLDRPAVVISHFSEELYWLSELGPGIDVYIMHKSHSKGVPFPGSVPERSALSRALEDTHPTDADTLVALLTNTTSKDFSHVDTKYLVVPPPSTTSVTRVSNEDGWGRECSGYLTWIVQHYDDLPRRVAFLQGTPIVPKGGPADGADHTVARRFAFLRRTLHHYPSSPREWFSFVDWAPPMFSRCVADTNWECCSLHTPDVKFLQSVGVDLTKLPQGAINRQGMSVCKTAKIVLTSATAAQFVVSREAIQSRTKEEWARALHYVVSKVKFPTANGLMNSSANWPITNCHAMEHMWHVLFGRLPNHVDCTGGWFSPVSGSGPWQGCTFADEVLQPLR